MFVLVYCFYKYWTADAINFAYVDLPVLFDGVAERINGILKDEFYCDEKFDNFAQAKKQVEQSIMIYNTKRPL